jgi:hypothetical protein
MANIFFNYYHRGKEKERANEIIRGLEEHGHRVFTDLGQHWREKIGPLLHDCDWVVLLLTPESLMHEFTVLEWSIAYGVSLVYKHLTLLPVILNEVTIPVPLADAGVEINAIMLNDDQIVEAINSKISESPARRKTMIFISHAHADEDLAQALVGVITKAFEMSDEAIRCTSVPRYKLPAGAHTASQLREEIGQTDFVLGIITPRSIESKYVLLELGAAWGLGKRTFPLVARGVKTSGIPKPLDELHWIDLASSSDCHQLIDDLSSFKPMGDRRRHGSGAIVAKAVNQLVAYAQQKQENKPLGAVFRAFYEDMTTDVTPPNLLFLAVAEHFTYPSSHGKQVARLHSAWDYEENEWEERSGFMERLGLLIRNSSSEVRRSDLGTAIVYLALRDPGFAQVASTMKANQEMAKKWGVNTFRGRTEKRGR